MTLAKLRPIARPYLGSILLVVALMFVAASLEALGYSLLVPLIQTLSAGEEADPAQERGLVLSMYDEVLQEKTAQERLRLIAFAVFAVFLAKHLVQYGSQMLASWTWVRIGTELRLRVFSQCLRKPYQFFLEEKQGRLIQQIFHVPHNAAFLVQLHAAQLGSFLNALTLFALLLAISWQFTLGIAVIGFVIIILLQVANRLVRKLGRHAIELEQAGMGLVAESVAGIRQIKVFSAESRLTSALASILGDYRRNRMRHDGLLPLPAHASQLLAIGAIALLLLFASRIDDERLPSVLPAIGASLVIFRMVIPHLASISQNWLTIQSYTPALEALTPFLNGPSHDSPAQGGIEIQRVTGTVAFSEVGFSYPNRESVLTNVSLAFRRGETTAIVGPSGAGKSTLIDLLVRLYEPTTGRITVEGVDLREYSLESWLDRIGFVSQDTFIFHGSIRENIAFSHPGAGRDEIVEAARLANAHAFIEALPEGYDTIVGDRGLDLSGGQRQRLAIARALLRSPDILILDEATSALDTESEHLVQAALSRVRSERIVIVISHRLSTVTGADRIVVLEGGRIVEEGDHESLIAKAGRYSMLQGLSRRS